MLSTTQTLSDTSKTFRFYDLFDNIDTKWCDVTINVKHLRYSGDNDFYDITYSYQYSSNNNDLLTGYIFDDSNSDDDEIYRTNPFYYKNALITSDMLDGVIVVKNSLTDEMVQYLMMEYDEMDNHIGNTWNVQYKANVMFTLAFLWD